ncbi:hypothetical protein JW935_27050, partial [candidate division KSB1 bacterium]|nr:hypothetical protein [candidate division KSB1 bacterium]
ITEPGFNYIKTYPLSPYVHMVIGSVILYYVNTGQFEKVQSKLFPYAKSVIPNYKCRTNIEQIYEMMVDKK